MSILNEEKGENKMQLNYENYLALEPLVRTGNMTVYTKDINSQNWSQYYTGCLNLMKKINLLRILLSLFTKNIYQNY